VSAVAVGGAARLRLATRGTARASSWPTGGTSGCTSTGRIESGSRGSSVIGSGILEIDLLEQEKIARLIERGEGALELQVRHHMAKGAIEATD
jgi:hypothetical protein